MGYLEYVICVEQAQFYSSSTAILPYTYLRVSCCCLMVVGERREACEICMGTYVYLYKGIMRTDLFGRAWHLKGAGIIRLPMGATMYQAAY